MEKIKNTNIHRSKDNFYLSCPWKKDSSGSHFCYCCSVAKSCLTLCDPKDCSTTSFLVLYYLLEFAHTHIHWVSDAIQPSHPLTPSSPQSFPASGTFPMSQQYTSDDQNTGFWASALVLPTSSQGWFPLRLTGLIFLLSKRLSGVFSGTIVWSHQLFVAPPSLQSSSHNRMRPLGRP